MGGALESAQETAEGNDWTRECKRSLDRGVAEVGLNAAQRPHWNHTEKRNHQLEQESQDQTPPNRTELSHEKPEEATAPSATHLRELLASAARQQILGVTRRMGLVPTVGRGAHKATPHSAPLRPLLSSLRWKANGKAWVTFTSNWCTNQPAGFGQYHCFYGFTSLKCAWSDLTFQLSLITQQCYFITKTWLTSIAH